MKKLIIAEKPSVATDLAKVLGKIPKKEDHYENDEYVISSAVGHLVELFMPEDIDKSLKRWTLTNLPIIPDKFKLKPIEKTKKKFTELKKLIARKDIDVIINACDAGREGELIFTYITELAKNKKPIKRLWMTSMTADAIRSAFSNLRDESEMSHLRDAARSRSEADWLIGINGTRGATIQFGRRGGTAATVGRVQTPTLSLVYVREQEIAQFKPRDFWRISSEFAVSEGSYFGTYQKPEFKKGDDEHDRIDRIWDKAAAEQILAEIQNASSAVVTEEKKRSKQSAPRLFDLTTLQREANSRFGFPAGMTLSIAQALYEKHKMLTYPRTDSKALPEDYGPTVQQTLQQLGGDYTEHARKIIDNSWINTANKRVFNNQQISDHFAIIPTDAKPKKLQEKEAKIYDMVVRRFMAIFYPPAEFDVTTRKTTIAEHTFKTEGKVLVVPGWLSVHGKATLQEDTLPALTAADGDPAQAKMVETELLEEVTKPPPRYTEATLLAAMEGAGKLINDEELAEAMKEKGLGTPATRAQTIDHLIYERYMERQGRELMPTAKAEGLMQFLKAFQIEALTSPKMTGEWEHKLHQIEDGHLSREAFMNGIKEVTTSIINHLNDPPPAQKTHIISPFDNKPLWEDHRGYTSKETIEVRGRIIPFVAVNKVIGNRKIEPEEVQELLKKKTIGPLDGFKSRNGKLFSANLKLVEKDNKSWRVELDFGNGAEVGENGEEIDIKQFPLIAKWPADDANIHETPNAYITDNYSREKGKEAGFRMSRNLLGKTIVREQFLKLINDKKTDLIQGFRSNKTGRLFDAFLVLKDDKAFGFQFEFPPRPPKKKSAKKRSAKKKAVATSKK